MFLHITGSSELLGALHPESATLFWQLRHALSEHAGLCVAVVFVVVCSGAMFESVPPPAAVLDVLVAGCFGLGHAWFVGRQ